MHYIDRLPIGGDSLFILELFYSQQRPILLLAMDQYQAHRFFSEIQSLNKSVRIAIFADIAIMPYERINPNKLIVEDRLHILYQLANKQIDILIVQWRTLYQKICPPKYILQNMLQLKIRDVINIDILRKQLLNNDYVHVLKVYESGEFVIRGSIIDIMPIGYKNLVRIELFDDKIESLRIMNHKDNTLIELVNEINIMPAAEYSLHDAGNTFVNNFIDYFHDSHHPYVDLAKRNILPTGIYSYMPLFFNSALCSLFDYLDQTWQAVYLDNVIIDLYTEILQLYDLHSKNYPCMQPNDLFLDTTNLKDILYGYKNYIIATTGNMHIDSKNLSISIESVQSIFDIYPNHRIIVVANSIGRLEILRDTFKGFNNNYIDNLEHASTGQINLLQSTLQYGFIYKDLVIITLSDLMGSNKNAIKSSSTYTDNITLAQLCQGDYVAHTHHGVGKYIGLQIQRVEDVCYEMLAIEYADQAKLFVSVNDLRFITHYASHDSQIELNKLGDSSWKRAYNQAKNKVDAIAGKLLHLYAERNITNGYKFALPNNYEEFVRGFIYEPTIDQASCINDVIADMTSVKLMDRLVCGDVGFGKTEVAMRATFIAVMNGKQVAVLTPTTLLAEQHHNTFIERFINFPVVISKISRFKSKQYITETIDKLYKGSIDIIIGTHRLLQGDIKFKNLGLIIIDEEHRFGVQQKELLKQAHIGVDCLTLSATPIPRTLSMALDGLRDLSIISTPPKSRLPIETILCDYKPDIIYDAVMREIRRGGQIFVLYNDVQSIQTMHATLTKLLPDIKIAIIHGQMPEHQLESITYDFINQLYHLLICSTIIENGIDIPNVNTMIIYRADKLGLAQLYQLRGRVGRSHHTAYCYLIAPNEVRASTQRRLDALINTTQLGSGLNLAIQDLEIRGAGDLLGQTQSGNIKKIGLQLYLDMLNSTLHELKTGVKAGRCEINLGIGCVIPDTYCADIYKKMNYYKQLSLATTLTEIETVYVDMIDSCGLPPKEVKYLFESHNLRVKAAMLSIERIDVAKQYMKLTFALLSRVDSNLIAKIMHEMRCRIVANQLICHIVSNTESDRLNNLSLLISKLSCTNPN